MWVDVLFPFFVSKKSALRDFEGSLRVAVPTPSAGAGYGHRLGTVTKQTEKQDGGRN